MEVNVYIDYYSRFQGNRLENLGKKPVVQLILLLMPILCEVALCFPLRIELSSYTINSLILTLGKINDGTQ